MSESSSGSEGDNSLQKCHIKREAEIDTETNLNNVEDNDIVTSDARPDDDTGLDIGPPPLDPTFCATPTVDDNSTTLESRNVDSNEPLTLIDSSSYNEPLNTEALPDEKALMHDGGVSQCSNHTQDLEKNPVIWTDGPSGLSQPANKSKVVVFHAILPTSLWEWDSESEVYIRFGHANLGNWQCDCGPMILKKDMGGGIIVLNSKLQIASFVLQSPLAYKYIVYSPKTRNSTNKDQMYEFIDSKRSESMNRVLLPNTFKQQKDEYNVFDPMICPRWRKEDPKSKQQSSEFVVVKISAWFGGENTPEHSSITQFPISDFEQMRYMCLKIYLHDDMNLICSGAIKKADILKHFNHITAVYDSLCNPHFIDGDLKLYTWSSQDLLHNFQESSIFLLEQCANVESCSNRMASVSLIACCLVSILRNQPLHQDATAILLDRLTLSVDIENKSCPEIDILVSLPKILRSTFLEGVTLFFNEFIKTKANKDNSIVSIYNFVAIYHILSDMTQQFSQKELDSKNIKWLMEGKQKPMLQSLHKKIPTNVLKENYCSLKPHFALDPILLPYFVYCCPPEEYHSLFEVIEPSIGLSRIAYLINTECGSDNKAKAYSELNVGLLQRLKRENCNSSEHPYMYLASLHMIESVLKCLPSSVSDEPHLQLLESVICIVLEIIDIHSDNENKCQQLYRGITIALTNCARKVIGERFGVKHVLWKSYSAEFKLWKKLFAIGRHTKQQKKYEELILSIVKQRVSKYKPEQKIELMIRAEDSDLSEIFTLLINEVTESLEELMLNKSPTSVAWQDSITKLQKSKNVGSILGRMLLKKYPKFSTEDFLTVDDILEWDYWPAFMKIYVKQKRIASKGMSDKGHDICSTAIGIFQSLLLSLSDGTTTPRTVEKLTGSWKQVDKIIEAIDYTSSANVEKPQYLLLKRNHEYEKFRKYRKQLQHICHHIDDLNIEGLDSLQEEFKTDFDDKHISHICSSDKNGAVVVHCFKIAHSLNPILGKFDDISQKHSNDFFRTFWMRQKQQHEGTSRLNFANVVQIWEDALKECIKFVESLRNRSISLSSVQELVEKREEKNISLDISNLEAGICVCTGATPPSPWIRNCVMRMYQYQSLCHHASAAKVFIQLKETLQLTGDFSIVQKLAHKFTESVKDKSLAFIDESFVETGYFLKGISSRKRKCLQVFTECQSIVNWIRNETKDTNDLQNFVTIAIATAAGGEDDFTRDKLSNLRTVGKGFAALIYKLPQDMGYKQLEGRCKLLWEALDQDSRLPELLESCNKHQEWYQSVKDTQGSVEKSSFNRMNNIYAYGCYKIGSKSLNVHTSLKDVLRLDLERIDKQLTQWKYTLDDLRDLESKLVLITSQDSEESGEVDLFMKTFNSVCRISEVLIELQQDGEDQYMGWEMKVCCRANDIVFRLGKQAKIMERDLRDWRSAIWQQRNNFYHLNYFTTQQLLALRRELGCFKEDRADSMIKHEIIALLHCVSRDITPQNVKYSFRIIATLDKQAVFDQSYAKDIQDSVTNNDQKYNLPNRNILSTKFRKRSSEMLKSIVVNDDIPQPILSVDEITDMQKIILANLNQNYGYRTKLVLLAFERCAEAEKEDEFAEWCDKHSEDFPYPDSDEETASIISNDEDDHDSITSDSSSHTTTMDYEVPLTTTDSLDKNQKISTNKVHIQQHVPIDKHHPTVIDLLEAGFDLEQSIKAASKYPDDPSAAIDYLDDINVEEGDTLFQSSGTVKELSSSSIVEPAVHSDGFGLEEESVTQRQDCSMFNISQTFVDDLVIEKLDSSSRPYLSLLELGMFLETMNKTHGDIVSLRRPLADGLKFGESNLLVVSSENVLKTVLSLYMKDSSLPMPTHEEVLICTEQTTLEEVTLLWKKAVGDPNKFKIFCLVYAEKLAYKVCDRSLRDLNEVTQGKNDYRLVIICSNEGQDKSHMVSKLQLYKRPVTSVYSPKEFSDYLKSHFTHRRHADYEILASDVDPEKSYLRVVRSDRAGMGKTHYISVLGRGLDKKLKCSSSSVVVPVHGPIVTASSIIDGLRQIKDYHKPVLFHLDIAPSVLWQVDSILFSLFVLQTLCDRQGRMWRCHPTHMYAIEVTVPESKQLVAKKSIAFLNLLPAMHCVSPRTALENLQRNETKFFFTKMDETEFKSPMFQRVFQYLRRHIHKLPLDSFQYTPGSVEGHQKSFLEVLLGQCGVHDPSWTEMRHFIWFLDTQIKSSEHSIFCNESVVGDVMSGFKTFVVKFMIRMSKDFATSSLKGEVALENANQDTEEGKDLYDYQIDERKQWEHSFHPYLFFNEDGASITFVGFNANRHGDLLDPTRNSVIEHGAISPQLYEGLNRNHVDLSENYQHWNKGTMIHKIGMVMGLEWVVDPDDSYVLTVDNVIKILAIHMRFRCNIPVVIMGETGCGKTRLIRFMCDLAAQGCRQGGNEVRNMLIMKIHGGTTERDIIKHVEEAEKVSVKNRDQHNVDTVLFFDEANTTEAIGLIKEVMCDRRINGRQIKENVKFIAACNPYKKHSDEMIEKLESAGLGFYIKATETHQKLGKIPLRQLVYRVLDLPPSMRPLVYDFGQLNNSKEKDYISKIVKERCRYIENVKGRFAIVEAVSHVLVWSQQYMRERKDECSFVSLRDVERAMIVFRHFCIGQKCFHELVDEMAERKKSVPVDLISRSLILSLSICYYARLQDRKDFSKRVVKQFKTPLVCKGVCQFLHEIKWAQDVLLNNMKLGENIARNAALRENVFMMVICIELRIPLFLVGKPGSSKSLAKSIVADSMSGRTSETQLLKEFKEVHMFSYQCSQLSTSESVIEVFNTAKNFQNKEDTSTHVSVVVLDEVGLAEDSPNLPLKALHPLLEDGTEGGDGKNDVVRRQDRVAFIGISNWALDPAKMNRGVMVTRGDPDEDELVLSAKGICSNKRNDPVKDLLQSYFKPFAAAYKLICSEQEKKKKAFFGLRDFYSLIKMLYWMCERCDRPPTGRQLEHVIKRNFGGYFDTYNIFANQLGNTSDVSDVKVENEKIKQFLNPDCTPLGLIRTSLSSRDTTWHGENRYLLFITENYAALEVLKHYINEDVGMNTSESLQAAAHNIAELDEVPRRKHHGSARRRKMEPFVLFGSSFPKDREYTQVCRNINQIKICMETGRTVILLNLENLYESLYDLLNQYYIVFGGTRYVDLGLQTHRVKCRVHNDFKLILIAEKETVYEKFPTPLINRLEKHLVLTKTILLDWQKEVLEILETWVNDFCDVSYSMSTSFTKQDAFIGFQDDTPSSVIFQATEQLRNQAYYSIDDEPETWKKNVFDRSCEILLQIAYPDALVRLQKSQLADSQQQELFRVYFFQQHHDSLLQFLEYHLQNTDAEGGNGLLMQVTTQSHLLSYFEIEELNQAIKMFSYCFLLQEFDTELDFSNKVSPAFDHSDDTHPTVKLLVIQCDSSHLYGDLVACARYRVDDEREKALLHKRSHHGVTHVLFIVNLPRKEIDTSKSGSKMVGFQGGAWISAHIDDIRQPPNGKLVIGKACSATINELFYNMDFVSSARLTSNVNIQVTVDEKERVTPVDLEVEIADEEIKEDDLILLEIQVEENSDNELKDQQCDEKYSSMEVTPSTRHCHPQCYRLFYCIQAAVAVATGGDDMSKEWVAQRVRLLLKLIPDKPDLSKQLDDQTFYGALVKHIKHLLKEGVELESDSQWVLNEALDGRRLKSGGTFQNVLSRRLDEIVIPAFASIIACIDQYSNLAHLNSKDCSVSLQQLWLQIFSNIELCQFSYEQMTIGRSSNYHPGTMHRMGSDFQCNFPFFWLIKECIEAKWDIATYAVAGTSDMFSLHRQLCQLVSDSPIAPILNQVDIDDVNQLLENYVHDYLRSMHSQLRHNRKTEEYKILQKALLSVTNGSEFLRNSTLLGKIIAFHVVHESYQKEIMYFTQLLVYMPGILVVLDKTIGKYSHQKFEVHLFSVQVALDQLSIPLDKKDAKFFCSRVHKLRQCLNTVDSILGMSESTLANKLRQSWHGLRAVLLFVEHVVLKVRIEKFIQFAKRLSLHFKKDCNFSKHETMIKILRTMNVIDSEIEKIKKFNGNEQGRIIKQCCHSFFMEVVSTLCFGQSTPPEEELVNELLKLVVTNDDKTRVFSYSDNMDKVDQVPVIRSFLLQLLMEQNSDTVSRAALDVYVSRTRSIMKNDDSLCLLCVQCFEDAFYKRFGSFVLKAKVIPACEMLQEANHVLSQHDPRKDIFTLQYFEAVAKLRYALAVVAELLYTQEGTHSRDGRELLELAKQCCISAALNDEDAGPGVFLVKQIYRRYGKALLTTLTSNRAMGWIVPSHLRKSNEDELQTVDHFVFYESYSKLRTTVSDAVYSEDFEEMNQAVQNLTPNKAIPFALASYQVVTLSRLYTDEARQITESTKAEFDKVTKHCKILNRPLKCICESLIQGTHCANLQPMIPGPQQTPENLLLADVVVHSAIVFNGMVLDILKPFKVIVNSPGDLKNTFLPTMPDDSLSDVRRALGEARFYECPNGHPYLVTECGKPLQEYTCDTCGSRIGGSGHKVHSTDCDPRTTDVTQYGYCLGLPSQRSSIPTPERQLSPAACMILRALLHCAFIWSSSNDNEGGLLELVKTQLRPRDMPQFFWDHLKTDINLISQATGKSKDEACLLLHLILKNIVIRNPLFSSGVKTYATLLAKEAREQWERHFNEAYIQPTLIQLDNSIQEATKHLLAETKEDRDRLIYTVYEKKAVTNQGIAPSLWTYRSRITLEHLTHMVKNKNCTIIQEFLKEEPTLRATQYITNIVQLQQQFHHLCNKKVDRSVASQTTVGNFIASLRRDKQSKFRENFNCLQMAMNLVKDKLLQYARVRVSQEDINDTLWDESLTLDYLIPTFQGHGTCTVALIDLLVGAHNEFIEKCQSHLKVKDRVDCPKQKIPVSHVQQCHLLNYEHHLMPIILSHCQYSLKYGQGQNVEYDLPALEKHLIDRFVHGKPILQLEVPQVVYKKDVYTATSLANIRKKVKPQVALADRERSDILTELKSIKNLRECLDVVDIVIGFLSSSGGDATKPLKDYLNKALKIKDDRFRSKKALEYCSLGHMLSLWEVLSVEMAKKLTLVSEEPFGDVKGCFLVLLNEDAESVRQLNEFLRSIDVIPFLGILYEFIEVYVRHLDPTKNDWMLMETLEVYIDQYIQCQLPPGVADRFPESITVGQAVSTWKAMIYYQKNYQSAD